MFNSSQWKIAIQRAPDPRGRIDPFTRFFSLCVSVGVLFCIVDCNNPVCYSIKAHINVISVLGVSRPFVSSLARARGSFLSLAFFVMSFIVRRFVCDFPLPFYVSPTWIMRCVCVQFQQYEFIHSLGGERENMKKEHPLSQFGTDKKLSHRIQFMQRTAFKQQLREKRSWTIIDGKLVYLSWDMCWMQQSTTEAAAA